MAQWLEKQATNLISSYQVNEEGLKVTGHIFKVTVFINRQKSPKECL